MEIIGKSQTLAHAPLRAVPVVEPYTSLDTVIELMREDPLKTVVLVGDEQFMGVFNEDALESPLIPSGIPHSDLEVGPYVHPSRVVGDPQMTVEAALALMGRRKQYVMPVVQNHTFLGVVTQEDLERL